MTAARGLLPALVLAALTAACLPSQASWDFGLGTDRIEGRVQLETPGPQPGGPLIVIYKYHHQFVTRPDGSPVVSATAQVLRPDATGRFSFAMPADVVRVVVLFVAPEHLTEVFRFSRQIGVGTVRYQADLPAIRDWRDHYFTFLSPQLQELIVEPRYRLPPQEQQLLAGWLQTQNDRLVSARRGS